MTFEVGGKKRERNKRTKTERKQSRVKSESEKRKNIGKRVVGKSKKLIVAGTIQGTTQKIGRGGKQSGQKEEEEKVKQGIPSLSQGKRMEEKVRFRD